ncbi:hypothetical protein [Ferruginibacter profundus]
MKQLFTIALVALTISLQAQDTVVIPKGVVYKKKEAGINSNARTLLQLELNSATVTYSLFDGIVFMGPRLWKRYKENPSIAKIKAGNVQFRVPFTDTITKKQSLEVVNGKLIQDKEDFKTLWKQVITDVGNTTPLIRKVKEKELSYYWAIINFDIEEPVFVVETINFNLLVQFSNKKMVVYWLEEMPKNG